MRQPFALAFLTRKLIANYTTDLKRAKWSLATSARIPARVPDTEWSNILQGRAVNLDAIFSGSISTEPDQRATQQVGEVELRFNMSKPTKAVRSCGDWVIAWGYAERAIMFAFPHREQEVTDYREYILSHFAALNSWYHHHVIELDKAI